MTAPENAKPATSTTPDDALAEDIVGALIEAKLMDGAKASEIRKKIASGEMDQDDWRALVEFKRPEDEGGRG